MIFWRSPVTFEKITFVSTMIGLIATNLATFDRALFVIPAFAAICFDFIIYSYSFSIKRIGSYTRDHIEPALKRQRLIPDDFVLWQQFLTQPKTKQNLALYGNLGLTLLVVIIGGAALFFPFRPILSLVLLSALIVFVIMDIVAYLSPRKLGKLWTDKDFELT